MPTWHRMALAAYNNPMRVPRRITAAILGILLLQLPLVGDGALCSVEHSMDLNGGSVDMSAMNAADMDASAHRDKAPCPGDSSPASCRAMVSCAAAIAIPAHSFVSSNALPHLVIAIEPTMTRSALPSAPELPPPRI